MLINASLFKWGFKREIDLADLISVDISGGLYWPLLQRLYSIGSRPGSWGQGSSENC